MPRKAPTSKDVALLAGVSQSTVSYVLTGSRPISTETRERVLEAIEKLGYHPNSGARTLRSRRSGVIGLMVPEARENDGVLMTFLAAITREARKLGYDILLVTAAEGATGIRRVVGTGICEGLILMELSRHDARVPAVLDSGLPFVSIGMPDNTPTGSMIDLDFERLGRMVVERSIEEDCAKLVLFGNLGRKRHRTDVSRFLVGVEETASGTGLDVVIDAQEMAGNGLLPRSGGRDDERTAVFALSGMLETMFAFAAAGQIGDPRLLFIVMADQRLETFSHLLDGTPQINPRRAEISELAVRELVRVLRNPGAAPRRTLVEPRWMA